MCGFDTYPKVHRYSTFVLVSSLHVNKREKAMKLREAAGAAAAAAATAAAQAAAEAAVAAAAAATARAQEAEARLQQARSMEESPPKRRSKRSVRFLFEPEARLYNELYHEHHPHARLCTLAGQFEGAELELLQPFQLIIMDQQRGVDASLLRPDGVVIFRNRDGCRMCGFDSYPKVHGFDELALSEQVRLQRLGTVAVGFLSVYDTL
jgi:ATPase subunit of ABC transporter with duplicated ATPase domains